VETAADIEAVRAAASALGKHPSSSQDRAGGALRYFDEILKAADGIMIAAATSAWKSD